MKENFSFFDSLKNIYNFLLFQRKGWKIGTNKIFKFIFVTILILNHIFIFLGIKFLIIVSDFNLTYICVGVQEYLKTHTKTIKYNVLKTLFWIYHDTTFHKSRRKKKQNTSEIQSKIKATTSFISHMALLNYSYIQYMSTWIFHVVLPNYNYSTQHISEWITSQMTIKENKILLFISNTSHFHCQVTSHSFAASTSYSTLRWLQSYKAYLHLSIL